MKLYSAPRSAVRLRERLRGATVEAILDAAEQAFAEAGATARMDAIATRAGIAVGTLYNHFADREALWKEVCRSRREALLVRLDETLEQVRQEPFEAALRAVVAAFVDHWAAHRGFLAVLMHVDPPTSAPGPRARSRTIAQELLERLAALVRRGVAQDVLRPEGSELYASLLLGMLRGVLFRPREVAPAAASADVEVMLDVFLNGATRSR